MNKVLNLLFAFLTFATLYELHIDDLFLTAVGVCSLLFLLILDFGLEIKNDRRVRVFQKSMGRRNKQ
jgi:hypothetical protein